MEKLTFQFTKEEANIMVGALGKLPYESSAQLIASLNKQFQEQSAKANQEKKLEPETADVSEEGVSEEKPLEES